VTGLQYRVSILSMLSSIAGERNIIMTLEQKILRAQATMFRLALRDFGLTLKSISIDSGIGYEALRTYVGTKGAQSMMPVSALCRLVGVVPDELLSHLLDPVGRQIVHDDDDSELDALGDDADAVAAEIRRARSPNSPGGTEIVDIEEARIRAKALRLRRKVA
jgi:hypothetical protein